MGTHSHNRGGDESVPRVGRAVGLAEARKRFGGPDLPVMDTSR
jgi:hypothetical protein